MNMIQELVILSNILDRRGLNKEADLLDGVIRKIANPAGQYEGAYADLGLEMSPDATFDYPEGDVITPSDVSQSATVVEQRRAADKEGVAKAEEIIQEARNALLWVSDVFSLKYHDYDTGKLLRTERSQESDVEKDFSLLIEELALYGRSPYSLYDEGLAEEARGKFTVPPSPGPTFLGSLKMLHNFQQEYLHDGPSESVRDPITALYHHSGYIAYRLGLDEEGEKASHLVSKIEKDREELDRFNDFLIDNDLENDWGYLVVDAEELLDKTLETANQLEEIHTRMNIFSKEITYTGGHFSGATTEYGRGDVPHDDPWVREDIQQEFEESHELLGDVDVADPQELSERPDAAQRRRYRDSIPQGEDAPAGAEYSWRRPKPRRRTVDF